MNQAHPSKRRQAGVTLIEAIIFLSIFSVVIGLVLSKAGIAFASNRAAQSVDAAQLISSGIKSAYQLRNGYTGLDNAAAIKNGLIPSHMVDTSDKKVINNVWGGKITVAAATTPQNGFTITFDGVPQDDCSKFVNAVSTSFDQISVGSKKVKTFGANGAADPGTVGSECSGGSGTKNVLLFAL